MGANFGRFPRQWLWARELALALSALGCALLAACASLGERPRGQLQYEVFTATDDNYGVTSTIFYGPTESILVDAQFTPREATRLADRIDALGRALTTIFVTHSDADHMGGLVMLHERFPNARIFMTTAGLRSYRQTIVEVRQMYASANILDRAPPVEPIASPLPNTILTVDGHRLEVVPDLQGDVPLEPANSVVWAPSLRILVAGDLAFDHVHVYMERSTPEIRAAWRRDLSRLQAMRPAIVIAGHKRDAEAPNAPAVLAETRAYMEMFERQVPRQTDAAALEAAMREAFPAWDHPVLLEVTAASMYGRADR